ncbi:hypothetical protein DVR12_22935 [Chitinophaga silvatica]|uniref:Uncharacterized protein n=1 Tax=Chitinophaga silvatica TaxID=2282649 RepID=A0A3E1Y4A5_9BACT|nr:hypothetical protein [Chitinophaga silvatica]RFS19493.1 hypothetical protein DVR12_22935 [Chitinophaga silvatica]
MKFNFRCIGCLFVFLLAAGMHCTYAQSETKNLSTLAEKDYCYNEKNPGSNKMICDESGIQSEMHNPSEFTTIDNQQFQPMNKSSKPSAHHSGPVVMEQRASSSILLQQNAILDKYVYLNRSTRDTVTVFVDIYSRGSLMMPVGVKYSGEQN